MLEIEPPYRTWLRKRWKDKGRPGQAVLPSSGADSTAAKESVRVRDKEIPEPGDGYWAGKAIRPSGGATSADSDAPVRCKVILDPGNGCWAGRALEYLRDVFLEVDFLAIHDRVDGLFRERNHIKCSERIPRAAEELGGRPVAQRSGHAFIRTSMSEREALFGAEVSGHFFFGELEGGDDGLFTACRMLRLLDESGRSLADWRRDCPPIFTTADLRVEVEPQEGEEAIERIKWEFTGYPQSFLDGVRVEFPEGWALVRPSVTAPELTFRFEGNSAGELEDIVAGSPAGWGIWGTGSGRSTKRRKPTGHDQSSRFASPTRRSFPSTDESVGLHERNPVNYEIRGGAGRLLRQVALDTGDSLT